MCVQVEGPQTLVRRTIFIEDSCQDDGVLVAELFKLYGSEQNAQHLVVGKQKLWQWENNSDLTFP